MLVAASAFFGPLGLIVSFALLPLIFAIGVFTGHNRARTMMLIGAVLEILSDHRALVFHQAARVRLLQAARVKQVCE